MPIVLCIPHHAVQTQEGGESHAKKPKYNIEYLGLREEILSKFYADNSFQETNDPKHPALCSHAFALRVGEVSIVLSERTKVEFTESFWKTSKSI